MTYQSEPDLKRDDEDQGKANHVRVDLNLNGNFTPATANGSDSDDQRESTQHGLDKNEFSRLAGSHLDILTVFANLLNVNIGILVVLFVVPSVIGWTPDHRHQLVLDFLGPDQEMSGLIIPDNKHSCVLDEGSEVMLLTGW